MPTADWYRNTADRLEAIAAQIVDTVNTVDAGWDNGVAIGGRVTTTIDRAITASIANATTIAGELYTRADECRNRAVACDDYTAALATYQANLAAYNKAAASSQTNPRAPHHSPRDPPPPHAPHHGPTPPPDARPRHPPPTRTAPIHSPAMSTSSTQTQRLDLRLRVARRPRSSHSDGGVG